MTSMVKTEEHINMRMPLNNKKNNNVSPTKTLTAQFTKRDLMLYALGIGCCSDSRQCDDDGTDDDTNSNSNSNSNSEDQELRFAYEDHPQYQPFPTFLLALSFVAEQQQQQVPQNEHETDKGVQLQQHTTTSKLGFGIRPFPPDSMTNYLDDGISKCGILPKEFFKNPNDIEGVGVGSLPILHMSQSLILHKSIKLAGGSENDKQDHLMIDPPTTIKLHTRIVSVKPRSIGTFVVSETKYYQDGSCVATAEMTALILGLDPDVVVPWEASPGVTKQSLTPSNHHHDATRSTIDNCGNKEKTTLKYHIPKNAALLYRLSGDYNPIHVEDIDIPKDSSSDDQHDDDDNNREPMSQNRGPLLHGLCTMAYAVRAILYHVNNQCSINRNRNDGNMGYNEARLVSVRCNFTKPVYIGDNLRVDVWDEKQYSHQEKVVIDVGFRVYRDNKTHSDVVVDKGKAKFCLQRSEAEAGQYAISRL